MEDPVITGVESDDNLNQATQKTNFRTDPVLTEPKAIRSLLLKPYLSGSMFKDWSQAGVEGAVEAKDFAEIGAMETRGTPITIEKIIRRLYDEDEKARDRVKKKSRELKEAETKQAKTARKLRAAQQTYKQSAHKRYRLDSTSDEENEGEILLTRPISFHRRAKRATPVALRDTFPVEEPILILNYETATAESGASNKPSTLTPVSTYRGFRFFAAEKERREAALLTEASAAKRVKLEAGSKTPSME